ncbi:glutathione S-transferase family protein [Sandarakinorhabdus rubra]|uniref:glutathione S-transferase family protein n=1 Tax=Sandarakinorhabdus rubra TaxID=2672568 RepID=UPI001F3B7362|nr:glutathione S-transferase family protein [Sandarakinorhabdus rubra]
MTMMKLWHCRDARSFRVLWALEELGLPYELVLLPFPPRWLEPAYLEINPLGTIPFFTDGDVKMTESAGICQYLAEKAGALRIAPDDPRYGAYLNFLHQSDATLTFPQTLVLRYTLLEKPENRNPKVASDYRRWFIARTLWVERHLADGRTWLMGEEFTVADIAVAYAFLLAETLGHLGELGPHCLGLWERAQARDGFRRAKLAQAA